MNSRSPRNAARRRALAKLAAATIGLALASAQAEDFPTKPVRFIFPSTAGGVGANLMHVLAQKLEEKWGQPVVVEPRPGANTSIGANLVAKAPPDGHTILFISTQHVMIPLSMRHLPYDAIRDFAPVAAVAKMHYLLAVNPQLPAANVQEFIALAKAKPGAVTYGSGGSGGPAHLAAELFSAKTGVKMQHIPYNNKGAAVVLADVMGGVINAYFTPPGIAGYVNSGKLRALAVSGDSRLPALPQVPTFKEAGLPDFQTSAWWGVVAPAGTPKRIVDKLAADFAEVVAMPQVREKMIALEVEPFTLGPARFGALMQTDMDRYAKLIKDSGLNLAD